ncbi:hypothetical protein [Pedobacter sp. NJ-S-72]
MQTIKDGHGMGLAKFPFDDKTGFGHTGGIDGFSSVYIYYPSDKIAVALTSNGSNYNNNKIITTMLNSIYNKINHLKFQLLQHFKFQTKIQSNTPVFIPIKKYLLKLLSPKIIKP